MDAIQTHFDSLRPELRFGSLFNAGRAFVLPCNAAGRASTEHGRQAPRR
ncbi:hypothetical protein [Ideonella sp. YS5]